MRRITKYERGARRVFLHAVLILGSFVFAIPFIWLFSTSFKVPDEMYPPRWIPEIPDGVVESPYISLRENEVVMRPSGVSAENWERAKDPIREAIMERIVELADDLPEFYRPYLTEPDLTDGVFIRLIPRAPRWIFAAPPQTVAAWFAERVDVPLITEVSVFVFDPHADPLDPIPQPETVGRDNWARQLEVVQASVTARTVNLAPELPEHLHEHLDDSNLAKALIKEIIEEAPEELFEVVPEFTAAWFADRVDVELVEEVFDTVYRRAAVSHVMLQGWDVLALEEPTQENGFDWEVISGDATLVLREEGVPRPGQEIHYSFANERVVELQTTVPMEMSLKELRDVSIQVHGDRSWHAVHPVIEAEGRRFEGVQPGYLGSDRNQEFTWRMPFVEDDPLMMQTWFNLREAGTSDFEEGNALRITLALTYQSRPVATWNKFLDNYRTVAEMVPLFTYIRNSVFLVVMNIAGQLIGSSLVAFAFARLRWPGRDACFIFVLATLMIPPQVTMIPVFLIVKNIGWYNTLYPLWVPAFFGSPFFIFLLRQFMKGIPTDLEDSAKIDGCGYLGIYTRVILPLIKPALATIGIFTFIMIWNEFMMPLIYLSDQELYPLSLGLFALQAFQAGNFGLMMAASVLMTMPVIILFFVAQRQFIQGIALTGMKN